MVVSARNGTLGLASKGLAHIKFVLELVSIYVSSMPSTDLGRFWGPGYGDTHELLLVYKDMVPCTVGDRLTALIFSCLAHQSSPRISRLLPNQIPSILPSPSLTMEPLAQVNTVDEKGGRVELYETVSTGSQTSIGPVFDKKATSRLIRKIDMRLLPFLALLYLLSFLDRTNIGNARLAGLEKSLGMTGLNYNVCAVVVAFGAYQADPSRLHSPSSFPSTCSPRFRPT